MATPRLALFAFFGVPIHLPEFTHKTAGPLVLGTFSFVVHAGALLVSALDGLPNQF